MTILKALGLALFTAIFFDGAWLQVAEPAPRAEQARRIGIPANEVLTRLNGIAMIGAALAIELPRLRRLMAAFLACDLLIVTIVGHRFWEQQPPQRRGQRIHFFKNLSLAGAALYIAATTEE